jgi:hypothetical protein
MCGVLQVDELKIKDFETDLEVKWGHKNLCNSCHVIFDVHSGLNLTAKRGDFLEVSKFRMKKQNNENFANFLFLIFAT